jgi:hypothetical protein
LLVLQIETTIDDKTDVIIDRGDSGEGVCPIERREFLCYHEENMPSHDGKCKAGA